MNNFSVRNWILAVRPKTFSASIAPVLTAGVLAGRFDLKGLFLWGCCFAVAMLLQAGANLANDYYDGKKGLDDNTDRLGPIRVTASGLIDPLFVKLASLGCIALAAAIGLLSAYLSSWLILIPGALFLFFAWGYTAGPLPLSYHGLGELAAFVFFGLAPVCGSYYVLTSSISDISIIAGIMFGLFASAIMAVNNLRDCNTDKAKGKVTVAVKLGQQRMRVFTVGIFLCGVLMPVLIAVFTGQWQFLLTQICLVPACIISIKIYKAEISKQFNNYLAAVSGVELLMAILFCILWVI